MVGFELRRILRSVHGILFLAFLATFFVWVGLRVYDLTETLREIRDPMARAAALSPNSPFYSLAAWLTDLDGESIRKLIIDHPPILLAFYFIALAALPFFAMLAAFDQTASDIHSRHIRYLLLRIDRDSLYIGKSLGVLVFLAAALGVVVLIGGTILMSVGGSPGDSMTGAALYMARTWLLLVFFTLPFVALLGLCNALVGHSFLSLVCAFGLYFFAWAASAIGSIANPTLEHIGYLSPSALKYHLMSDRAGELMTGMAHQGGYAIACFVAGLLFFRWRDV